MSLTYSLQSFEAPRASLHGLKFAPSGAMVLECSYVDLISPEKNPYLMF